MTISVIQTRYEAHANGSMQLRYGHIFECSCVCRPAALSQCPDTAPRSARSGIASRRPQRVHNATTFRIWYSDLSRRRYPAKPRCADTADRRIGGPRRRGVDPHGHAAHDFDYSSTTSAWHRSSAAHRAGGKRNYKAVGRSFTAQFSVYPLPCSFTRTVSVVRRNNVQSITHQHIKVRTLKSPDALQFSEELSQSQLSPVRQRQ
jgi:hypothetical protein